MQPEASKGQPSTDPNDGPELPLKPRRRFGWPFWLTIGVLIIVGAVLAIPSFVSSRCGPTKNSCIANLKQIDGAAQQWALENHKAGTNVVTISDLLSFIKGSFLPVCPEHGIYGVSTVSEAPTCTQSAKGHSL